MTISHACVKKEGEEERKDFEELSVVFRAGREGENYGTCSGVMLEVSDCISLLVVCFLRLFLI